LEFRKKKLPKKPTTLKAQSEIRKEKSTDSKSTRGKEGKEASSSYKHELRENWSTEVSPTDSSTKGGWMKGEGKHRLVGANPLSRKKEGKEESSKGNI